VDGGAAVAHPEPLEWNVAVGRATNDDQCLSMLPHQCARRLAERLLQRTEELLRSPIQKHLSGVITGELLDSDLKGAHHDLIYKVLQPSLMLLQLLQLALLFSALASEHLERTKSQVCIGGGGTKLRNQDHNSNWASA